MLKHTNSGHYSNLVYLISVVKCVQLISMQVDSECSFHVSWHCDFHNVVRGDTVWLTHSILRISVLQRKLSHVLSEVECGGSKCLLALASVSAIC